MDYQKEWDYVRRRIKELRIAKGLSIQALADIANIDRPNLSYIESGKAKGMFFETLCKIAEALDVKPSELVR